MKTRGCSWVGRWTDIVWSVDWVETDDIFADCCFFSTFGSTFVDTFSSQVSFEYNLYMLA